MNPARLSCNQANQFDLVDYLASLGYHPIKKGHSDYWYLSPLREEKTASFKVNQKMNAWYDHGMGKGGSVVDFGILYFHCSVKEFLRKLQKENGNSFSFHQPPPTLSPAGQKKDFHPAGKILVLDHLEITDPALRSYLHQRQIPLPIANQFCQQVSFELYNKKHLAIGFKNNHGGYELRSQFFKGSSAPKDTTLLEKKEAKTLAVFEGFFSFLSFQTLLQTKKLVDNELPTLQSYLILNSLSFFGKSRESMESFNQVHLYLDRDAMGLQSTRKAQEWSSIFEDRSRLYAGCKDLNDHLVKSTKFEIRQSRNKGMHF